MIIGRDSSVAPVIARTVMPRKPPMPRFLPIIAVGDDCAYIERSHKLVERSMVTALIASEPSSMIVVSNAAHYVQELDFDWFHDPRWQFRATPVTREVYQPNRKKSQLVMKSTIIGFCGFTDLTKKGNHRYHYPIDPALFLFNSSIHELRPEDRDIAEKCYLWGRDLREWIIAQKLTPNPTVGGLAAQLLRDPRFYPNPRRKVPRATNTTARPRLPGNYYELLCQPNSAHNATYLDQSASHHNCALTTEFPHADQLRAQGRFTLQDKIWAPAGHERFTRIMREYGLMYVELDVPYMNRYSDFPPPYARNEGVTRAWIYTNEVPRLESLGITINGVIAAWTSPKRDDGLNQYALWALEELDASTVERKRWLKPALLAPYGILAATARPVEFGYRRSDKGEEAFYPVGSGKLKVKRVRISPERESGIVNVIQRGMIEAECRQRTQTYAQLLDSLGYRVLALYADSLFVEAVASGASVAPPLPHPWKVEARLTRLEFFSATSFVSTEMSKLPGIEREKREAFANSGSLALAALTPYGTAAAADCADVPRKSRRIPRVKSANGVDTSPQEGHHGTPQDQHRVRRHRVTTGGG